MIEGRHKAQTTEHHTLWVVYEWQQIQKEGATKTLAVPAIESCSRVETYTREEDARRAALELTAKRLGQRHIPRRYGSPWYFFDASDFWYGQPIPPEVRDVLMKEGLGELSSWAHLSPEALLKLAPYVQPILYPVRKET